MPPTNIRGAQVLDGSVQRTDLDASTVGQAVVRKIVQGAGITLSSTGADSGTGDVTVLSPVSTDSGNIATLGTDSLVLVPQSQIWNVRLRSFNAVGHPTTECDQTVNGSVSTNAVRICDRWFYNKAFATGVCPAQRTGSGAMGGGQVLVPGTSYTIGNTYIRFTLTTAQATLAAGDFLALLATSEGSQFRELQNDVHSLQVLVRSSVAGITFGCSLRDPSATRSLTKLGTIASANTWTLVTFPNLPAWPSAGNFSSASGNAGYQFTLTLASGTTNTSPANDTWQTGNFGGATGQANWLAQAVNSTFDIAFVQHEPGPNCTQLIDKPFSQNLDECLRYFDKSYIYSMKPGTVDTSFQGASVILAPASFGPYIPVFFKKRMAKNPSVSIWSPATGGGNAVRDTSNSIDRAVSAVNYVGETGYSQIAVTGPPATLWGCGWHWTADSGW